MGGFLPAQLHQWKDCVDDTAGILFCVPKGKCPLIKPDCSAACVSIQKSRSTGLSTGSRLIWWKSPFMDSQRVAASSRNQRRMISPTFTWVNVAWMTNHIYSQVLFFLLLGTIRYKILLAVLLPLQISWTHTCLVSPSQHKKGAALCTSFFMLPLQHIIC